MDFFNQFCDFIVHTFDQIYCFKQNEFICKNDGKTPIANENPIISPPLRRPSHKKSDTVVTTSELIEILEKALEDDSDSTDSSNSSDNIDFSTFLDETHSANAYGV